MAKSKLFDLLVMFDRHSLWLKNDPKEDRQIAFVGPIKNIDGTGDIDRRANLFSEFPFQSVQERLTSADFPTRKRPSLSTGHLFNEKDPAKGIFNPTHDRQLSRSRRDNRNNRR